ncbi:MAG: hypothetical protein M1817_000647 [Caeruleum heppii]|nr:MAG: hypothetical protein M1817_000647 [Caeruleum heppii]
MAPSAKKKKKVASNPARGFATTSTISKKAVEPAPEDLDGTNTGSPAPNEVVTPPVGDAAAAEDLGHSQRYGTDQLSPEDFEKHLQNAELQNLVDKHAQRCKRESSRQVARLHTERRKLRGQAEPLPIRQWLPQELMEHITDLLVSEDSSSRILPEKNRLPKSSDSAEDSLVTSLWVLKQTLTGLNVSPERVTEVIDHVLRQGAVAVKETIWGLNEALDWLALACGDDELPDYDRVIQQAVKVPIPITTDTKLGLTPPALEPVILSSRVSSIQNDSHASTPNETPLMSDSESELDPEELLPRYLTLKSRLHDLQPKASLTSKRSKKQATPDVLGNNVNGNAAIEISKLMKKITNIETDILFDKDDADQQWAARRIELDRMRASRQKYGLTSTQQSNTDNIEQLHDASSSNTTVAEAQTCSTAEPQSISDDDDPLGDLFRSLPEQVTDPTTGDSRNEASTADGGTVIIRDFGRPSGTTPRRVLEEVCRARDTAVKLSFDDVSSSSYLNRQTLTLKWSIDQVCVTPDLLPSVACSCGPRIMTFAMTGIATPDAKQSEAYVSTAALFLLSVGSATDEKVYLRLPSVWRGLWTEFASLKKERDDEGDRLELASLLQIVRENKEREEEEGVVLKNGFRKRIVNGGLQDSESEDGTAKQRLQTPPPNADHLRALWTNKASSTNYQRMLKGRTQLPIWGFKDQVLSALQRHQVIIICGETGCGKSTQVPAFVLESELSEGRACNIYCTEPRRISAISLARRVSDELGERKNDIGTPRSMVGYAIRLESKISSETRLVYATTGIVMRMLERTRDLAGITHLVLDEVHERSIDSDFLLIVLRELMVRRPELKVVLMSATVDAQRFSSYLNGAPVLNVPGRTFPVETRYLEDAVELTGYRSEADPSDPTRNDVDDTDIDVDGLVDGVKGKDDLTKSLNGYSRQTIKTLSEMNEYNIDFGLISRLVECIAVSPIHAKYSKAILVFLPGIAEIRRLNDMLLGHPNLRKDCYVYPLHSTIASEEQEQAFLVPPPGVRKIVLATNIAETGITIPDITCVIDAGKHKEMRFDERRQLSRLIESFISRANAKQRRGRAGRVQEGVCFHLFTKPRHDHLMAEQQTPEMLRLSLQDLVLRVKICKLGDIEETLSQALDAPPVKNIRRAIDALVDVKALTAAEELTPLGAQLAKLPLDVHLGKLILLGSIYNCLDVTVTIAAILSSKSPFSAPMGARSQADLARMSFKRGDSDLLTLWNAYCAWRRVCQGSGSEYSFCRKNFLSPQTLANIEDLKQQLLTSVVDAGFLTLTSEEMGTMNRSRTSFRQRSFVSIPDRINAHSDNDLIASSVIAWSLYPKILVREGRGWRSVANNQAVSLHPSSVNKRNAEARYLSFYHIMQGGNKIYNAHETTPIDSFALALVCGEAEFKVYSSSPAHFILSPSLAHTDKSQMYAGVLIIDGNRLRFSASSWKQLLALKTLRARLREIRNRRFKNPGTPLPGHLMRWMEVWRRIFEARWKHQEGR